MIKTFECKIDEIEDEDGGRALIATAVPEDGDIFFRIQSWDEDGDEIFKHNQFNQLGLEAGKTVKITIEV